MYNERNPFTFGALALDDAFTNREDELRELASDIRNGQDVLVYAPRRYGKSSLVLRAARRLRRSGVLVAYCDLMKTPTKERFAAALAKTIWDDLASPVGHAVERAAALFRGLRVRPTIELDPDDVSLRFAFEFGGRQAQLDDTIERLLELPGRIGAERGRRVAVVFDEFQEVVRLDPLFPNLLRAVFQTQPEVAHVYLGSRRHVLERIFDDANEPFWRSARRVEIGPIAPAKFARFVRRRFEQTSRTIDDAALERLLESTGGHPYATQELAYFVWEGVPAAARATVREVEAGLAKVLLSEHNHFARIWEEATHNQRLVLLALASEPGSLYAEEYRARHGLPATTFVQRAVAGLAREELVAKGADGRWRIVEPFLADWVAREQRI